MADQMTTAEDVFEEPEEGFNRPAMFVNQRDHFRRHVQQVGRDQDRIALFRSAARRMTGGFAVRLAFDLHDTQRAIEIGFLCFRAREPHQRIANDLRVQCRMGTG